eukprot:scaffold55898_cov78-Phaeocystis_antarctica.AAC.1
MGGRNQRTPIAEAARQCWVEWRAVGVPRGVGVTTGARLLRQPATRAVSACATRATRLARTRKRAQPLVDTPVQAQPHRLRSKRDATRRPGAAGGCGAAVLGQRVRGRPVPKGMQELNQLHTCPGLRRNPWQWYEPAGPTGDRHDAHVASMEHVYHRDGASASPTGARTARWPQATESCARKRAAPLVPALPERGRARPKAQRRDPIPPTTPGARVLDRDRTVLAGYHPSRRPVGTAYDRAQIRTKAASTSPEWISGLRLPRRGAQAGVAPPATEYCGTRFGDGLQNAILASSPPDCPSAPGSHTCRLRHVWFWRGGGRQRPSYGKVGVGHAERRPSTWVGALSRAMASDVPGSAGKPEQVLQHAESALPVQNRPISGACTANTGRLHTASRPVVQRAAHARTREVLRSDRGLAAEARSPPTQVSCVAEPEHRGDPAAATFTTTRVAARNTTGAPCKTRLKARRWRPTTAPRWPPSRSSGAWSRSTSTSWPCGGTASRRGAGRACSSVTEASRCTQLTRRSRSHRTVRADCAYQPPACCTYQRRRAACLEAPRLCVPRDATPVPRTVAPQALQALSFYRCRHTNPGTVTDEWLAAAAAGTVPASVCPRSGKLVPPGGLYVRRAAAWKESPPPTTAPHAPTIPWRPRAQRLRTYRSRAAGHVSHPGARARVSS